jgi:peroxiredoxin Q/BCP
MLEEGREFPDFSLKDADGAEARRSDLSGRWAAVYFFSRIGTQGCAVEAAEFSLALPEFEGLGAQVVGVSPDSPEALRRARDWHSYGHRLLSDPERALIGAAGAWQRKRLYGREFMGVVRTTALVDPGGTVRRVWTKVRPKGHADAVLKALREAAGGSGG